MATTAAAAALADRQQLPALKVMYATQKGTARRYAQTIVEQALASGAVSSAVAVDLLTYEPEDLATERSLLVFVMATYTDGQPTDSGRFFCSWLEDACTDFRVQSGFLSGVRYTIFGLGNSLYEENFNKVAVTVDGWMQVGGATRVLACGVGDESVSRADADGSQEKDFRAWLQAALPALAGAAASLSAAAAAAQECGCANASSACGCGIVAAASGPTLSAEQEREIREDLAAEEAAEEAEAESGASSRLMPREPLVDLEDMGPIMRAASDDAAKTRRPRQSRGIKQGAKAAAAAAAAAASGLIVAAPDAEVAIAGQDDDEDDENAEVGAVRVGPARSMVTDEIRQSLTKQGYKIIGSHSGVKLCRWTKAMLRYASLVLTFE